ncbi:hypothetical protein [Pseudomonas sp.]|uniref:hypothetical protein n=1 Tax=Pseudomonas sp. TaxID=306 RepID=UPI00262BBFF7|nr:hypothetical protein [Pseudomonas sp.]
MNHTLPKIRPSHLALAMVLCTAPVQTRAANTDCGADKAMRIYPIGSTTVGDDAYANAAGIRKYRVRIIKNADSPGANKRIFNVTIPARLTILADTKNTVTAMTCQ